MGTLIEDAKYLAVWVSQALTASGYRADFTIESLKEIDRFFDEQTAKGKPKRRSLLSDQTGQRIFALGAYTGEVIVRNYGGEWYADEQDPYGEMNIAVHLPTGHIIWPMQRMIKRMKNGKEDSIYAYGWLVTHPSSTGNTKDR